MPILKSAFKRVRADKKRRLRNAGVTSELKTLAKNLDELILQKKLDLVKSCAGKLISKLDKAVRQGILHKNAASRKKSRIGIRLAKLQGRSPA